jgi:hypothetical protein
MSARRFSRLGHFLGCCWFWRSDHAGPKLGSHSALKPNLAPVRVLLAHSFIVSCARPPSISFETFIMISSSTSDQTGRPFVINDARKIRQEAEIVLSQILSDRDHVGIPFWAIAKLPELWHKP